VHLRQWWLASHQRYQKCKQVQKPFLLLYRRAFRWDYIFTFIAVFQTFYMLRNKSGILFLLVSFQQFVFCSEINAQFSDHDFIHYSVKEGLTDNSVTCIAQDDQGYVWVATEAGLNRFDGHQFKKFYQFTEPLHLLSSSIFRIRNLKSHQFGIHTRGGFQLLNTQSYLVKNFVIPDSTAFQTYLNANWDAMPLDDGSFAITTAAGFYVFDASGKVVLRHDAFNIRDIGQTRILYGRDIFNVGNGQYLIYINENGLAHYDHNKKIYTELDSQIPPGIFLSIMIWIHLAPGF
jgi:ligand-binding sensor domain-containing protein